MRRRALGALGRVVYLTIRLPVSAEPVNAPGELRWYAMALTFTRGVLKAPPCPGTPRPTNWLPRWRWTSP
ncbi:hypothetical protein J8F10_13360 [Gemmata sp. G18]|uniref:Uncharacterized protein n=1 Tax=Gemmata palustris TaxID=2822762 RepID=A0ABS5BRB0_9BACT|nr:hypothetical protein [Gemmata palustris]MBP3956272.1 hypothetical protein [Gemmata palustris]